MRSALIAGVALVALALPSLAQNTSPSQPGTTSNPPAAQPQTPPAAQPQTPPTVPSPPSAPQTQAAPPAASPAPPAAQRSAPSTTPTAQQGEPARMSGSHLIGLTLRNPQNESIGDIDDVIVDRDGRVREVIVGVGGFLGIGEHKVAIAWDQLQFDASRDVAVVNMTKDQLRAMPAYRADRPRDNTAPATGNNPPAAAPPARNTTPGTTAPAAPARQP